jgi:hypothetical protein
LEDDGNERRRDGRNPFPAASDKTCVKQFAAVVALFISFFSSPRQQSSTPRVEWPCGGHIDLSYFQVAEGTGGHLLLLAPEEIGDSAALLTALGSHRQTIFRLAGSLNAGMHEFQVPIDSSVASVLFSISVQCLQVADVIPPSGGFADRDAVVDLSNFRAERMVIVKHPEPGMWTLRVSGSGISGIVVQARSPIAISQVEFAPAQGATFGPRPAAGVENAVRISVSGATTEVHASVVNGLFQPVAKLPRETDQSTESYLSRFAPGADAFRVLIAGRDNQGLAFQRMYAPLYTAMSTK